MTDDDWAPLPPDDLHRRPGDGAGTPVRAGAVPTPHAHAASAPRTAIASEPPLSPEQQREEEREAERALAALRSKLAQSGPATSLIAEVAHREQKVARKHRAAHQRDLAAVMIADAAPTPPRPVLEYDVGPDGRDAREDEEWFARLPADEQQRLHAAWTDKRASLVEATSTHRRVGNRRFVAAMLVFAATWLLGTGSQWYATVGAALLCGWWWRQTSPDRFQDPVRAAACFLTAQVLAMTCLDVRNPAMGFDSVLLVAFAAIVGFDGEIRRTGGFDAKR